MRLRHLAILMVALFLLSALVGLSILFYLYVWRAPPAVSDTLTTQTQTATAPFTPVPEATSTPVPPLATLTHTHTPNPTPTPSPTPTLTPTPTLSPTPLPAARLANAHRAKRNGDYRRARAEFLLVLEAPEAEWEAVDAGYEVGVCAYLEGDYRAARDLLGQFIQKHPDDHRIATAHFHLAEALTGLGEHAAAIEHYRAYLERQDVLADQIYTRIGDGYMALGEYEASVKAYELALEHTPDLGQQYDLREQIGVAYSAWGRYDESISWLQGIIERSQNVYRLARIWYLIGQVYRMAGQEPQALDAFSQAVYGDPRPGYAHAALVALLDVYVEVDEYQRGLIDYYAESYEAAVGAFYRYMETTPDYNSDAHYYTALSYLNAGSYDLAIQECERALAEFPNTIPHWGEMWLIRAQALARLDRANDAVKAYIDFADVNPDHPLASQARWEAAQLLEQADRFHEAADVYTSLADRHVNDDRAPAARFRAGICRYRGGDPDAAMVAWRELVNGYPSSTESLQGNYWLGKVLWARGEADEAREFLQPLAVQYPRNYYGLRAAHMLESSGQVKWPVVPTSIHQTSDEKEEEREVTSWLHEWIDIPEGVDLSTIPPKLADDVRFRRGMELLSLGLRDQARDAFEALRKDVGQDPLALYQLAIVTRDLGLYAPSLRATINLIALAPENSVLDMPRLIQRMAFPTYFDDLVTAECAAYDLDPLLMFALIRQESVFDDQASSWAGAVGLTQIMPSTGEWIAEMMPWPEYQDDYLKRAYLNVKFGAWFMDRILQGTEGDVMAALAGYNGGPANGAYWLEQSGGDPDLFVEIITRDEPQRYVREIYRHYDVYVRLYGNTRTD